MLQRNVSLLWRLFSPWQWKWKWPVVGIGLFLMGLAYILSPIPAMYFLLMVDAPDLAWDVESVVTAPAWWLREQTQAFKRWDDIEGDVLVATFGPWNVPPMVWGDDDIQYFPVDTESKLANQIRAMDRYKLQQNDVEDCSLY